MKPKKPKKCGYTKCPFGGWFTPKWFSTEKTHANTICQYGYLQEQREIKEAKNWAKEKKKIKEGLMSLSDHIQDLQNNYFNKYIRLRDRFEPCISCGTTNPNIQYHAGHYVAAGKSNLLRFNEYNVHKQCGNNCNKHKHGNTIEYRINLVKKIGVEKVLWLEENIHAEKRWTVSELKELKEYYKQKIKELSK